MRFLKIYFCVGLCLIASSQSDNLFEAFDDGRIVGGEPADIKDIPYQLSVREANRNWHFCGASIISYNWAVSAAHCFQKRNTELILVAGATTVNRGGSKHKIIKIIRHPSYDDLTSDNDIALLQVKEPFALGTPGVNCIALASKLPNVDIPAQTSGWGYSHEGASKGTDQLQRVLVPLVPKKVCNKAYRNMITENMICAGYTEGGKDACQGDSGGPLVIKNQLVGIVSWGHGCAEPGYPGVYTRVDRFYDWINQVTGIFNTCQS